MPLPVENLFRHVAGSDDGAWHNPGDFLAGSGKAEDVPSKDADALSGLFKGTGRFRGLRVIDNHEAGTDTPTVGAFVFHAADSTGDPGNTDDDPACGASFNRWKNKFVARPCDAGALPMVQLTGASVYDAVKTLDGENDFGEVFGKVVVDFQFRLDGIEHFQRRCLGRANQRHELAVPV